MPTIKDIAEMANVSRTTVSRVLNNSGYVSEEVRKRILKIIEETGYVPNEHAKSLRTKQTKVIGVILPKISTETSSRLVSGIDEVLAKEGYQILLANTNLQKEKEIESINLLKVRQVDGIILTATNINRELVREINQLNIPFVVIGQEIPGVSNVLYDDYHAAREITTMFIEKGHKKIAFIGVDESDRAVGYWRKKGYLDVMAEHGFAVEEAWVQKGVFDIQSGYEAMKRILEHAKNRPTAIFAVTDRLAIGAMQYMKEKGFSIPKEIVVAGIGASELSKYVTPTLTTVDYQNENAGREAAKLILNHIIKKDQSTKKIILDYRLIIRDSV
ncbi:LacI family sucrose operon transcriptional repressor [Caldalkalibacillus uzonensis]|uniref:LacI family sucrose operon transcriptional repressor n=1 Tax=Caldalkalibacillus uzonensis TaxID=353224 RepID=A0ABU0CMT2_9BACI|nr:LacI family DNA-binding transcriptional regulator [Caldalkalibacillus uzonensis]MDQ0337398.1 LacI family sucrose operon transcriptional repressor [Caldalkalibacillus uzonensis]